MHTCFWDLCIILVNICPNNFAVKLKQSVAWDGEGGEARLPRDSVHSNISRDRERTVIENTTSRKLSVDLWPTIVENRLVYLSQVWISCSFSHLKNCQATFILWLISSLNHVKMDLIFGWTPGEFWIQYGSQLLLLQTWTWGLAHAILMKWNHLCPWRRRLGDRLWLPLDKTFFAPWHLVSIKRHRSFC